ncbi:uncharacterized protein (TIRG00374 family) [Phaeovulum vinaykumarii]|uniref:Lysylphosphatidylglycerol synthase TM region n=3 Tax=Phaeovulum vinaykumarii TaxID=407234 RepID=A0A1N7K0P1_9RHOB|nr:conserved hypothetical protein [Phaeovulum vinaykumarii]SOB92254.1 uncharacterized protein (TIRG00374 family) [Phaeovulum vinaykumarii]
MPQEKPCYCLEYRNTITLLPKFSSRLDLMDRKPRPSRARKAPARAPRAPRSRPRELGLMALMISAVLAGLAGLAAATGWDETWAALERVPAQLVAVLLALSGLNYLLRGLRWHLTAERLGLPTPMKANLRHFIGGFALSVTPGRLGELVRLRWIARETGWRAERAAPLVIMDRAGDLAALALLLALAAGTTAGGDARSAEALTAAGGALVAAILATHPRLIAGGIGATHATLRQIAPPLARRLLRPFARARAAAASLARFTHGPTLLAALALGMLGWLAESLSFHLLLGALGADLGLARATAIFVFATLVGGATGAPGGLGGAEATMVALLTLDGVDMPTALAATALIRLTTLWFAILLGLLVFPTAERISKGN